MVLIVDDNAGFARVMVRLLENRGQPAVAATTSYDAIDALDETCDIALVVADIRMPEIDGFDFIRVVRYRFPSVRLALMTAYPFASEDLPPDVTVLRKPFEVEAVLAMLPAR